MRKIILLFFVFYSATSLTQSFDVSGECGRVKVLNPNALVFNGTELYHGQSPWLASLFIKEGNRCICGSSIITKWHLLSAAHCVISENSNDFYSLMGHFDLSNSTNSHEQRRDIQLIHTHHTYKTTKHQMSTGDIAIFKVTQAIDFNDFVQPVCLPESNADVTNLKGHLSGYGITEPIQARTEDRPSFVELKSVHKWVCLDKALNYGKVVSEFSFCAGNNHSIPCQGDSGGGFYVYDKLIQKYTTYGVLSHGIGYCNPREYVVFVEVPKYVQWIHEAIDSEKDDSKCPDNQACVNDICIDLCSTANTCVANSQCIAVNHKLKCECNSDYDGNESLCTHFINGTIKYSSNYGYYYFEFDEKVEIKSKNIEIHPNYKNITLEIIEQKYFGYKSNFLPIKVDEVYPNLKKYYVAWGSLNEINQENFKNLNKLEELKLESNKVELVIRENSFDDLINLKILDLYKNRITKLPEKLFENNRKLEQLVLGLNKLTSLSEKLFQNLIELKELHLYSNQLSTLPENIFKNLRKLQTLYLPTNQLTSLPGKLFENLTELKKLYLKGNLLSTLPESILIKNVKLEKIRLDYNEITSLSYRIFENKIYLKYVNLEDNVCIHKQYGDNYNENLLTTDERESLRKDLQEKC